MLRKYRYLIVISVVILFAPLSSTLGQEVADVADVEALGGEIMSLVRFTESLFGITVPEPLPRVRPWEPPIRPVTMDKYTPRLPAHYDGLTPFTPFIPPKSLPNSPENWFSMPRAENLLPDSQIKNYQQILRNFGYDIGKADGKVGDRTKKALGDLQIDFGGPLKGLHPSMELDEWTQGLLKYMNDLAGLGARLLRFNKASREKVVSRSTFLRGVVESDDGIDLYLRKTADDNKLILTRTFGALDFEILRVHRSGKRLSYEFLNRIEANLYFQQNCESLLKSNSTAKVRLLTARRMEVDGTYGTQSGFEIMTPNGSFEVSAAEAVRLSKGRALGESHPLSKEIVNSSGAVVFVSNALTHDGTAEGKQFKQLVLNIQRSYPKARIFQDDYRADVPQRAEALAGYTINGPDDLRVVLDDTGTIIDWGIMADLRDDLERLHVKVIDYKPGVKWDGPRGKAVIGITGHIDQKFYDFVQNLISDGYFKDNYVLFNACSGPMSEKLVAELNQKGGAAGTFRFEGRIGKAEVQELLLKIVEKLKANESFSIHELSPHNLRSKLKGIWVLCENESRRRVSDRA